MRSILRLSSRIGRKNNISAMGWGVGRDGIHLFSLLSILRLKFFYHALDDLFSHPLVSFPCHISAYQHFKKPSGCHVFYLIHFCSGFNQSGWLGWGLS